MPHCSCTRFAQSLLLATIVAHLHVGQARATTITIDYRYDVGGFFNPQTASGMKARASVDAAASFFSSVISDTLSAIPVPSGGNFWRQVIMHPGTGQMDYTISSASGPLQEAPTGWHDADEYRTISIPSNQITIYAGATDLSVLAIGGGGFASYGSSGFNDNIRRRGKPTTEYSTWGGYISFDNAGVAWHVDHQAAVPAGRFDLYSTALHEIGHVLGLNPSLTQNNAQQWRAWQLEAEFRGPGALAAWKADDPSAPASANGIPTVSSTNTHWRDNAAVAPRAPAVRSNVLGTHTLQEAAMDPSIFPGTRKRFTNVDTRALQDIGWTIPSSVFNVTTLPADFTGDGLVNGADLTRWKTSYGQNAMADADGDGDSDGRDFLLWQRQFGGAAGGVAVTASSTSVPEPATAVLATWCVMLGGLTRVAGQNRGSNSRDERTPSRDDLCFDRV